MAYEDMPIFTRTFELLSWLLPASNHFPKAHRHSYTRRLLDAAFALREHLEAANVHSGAQRKRDLQEADIALANVRMYLRLAVRWKWLTESQYLHAAAMIAETGKLLGGWLKRVGK